jgi:multiple sugar transport system ATP-binding protein
VTHDQTEAMTLGQRVAVLDKGIVQQVDAPQRLYRHPANTFVASFIGSPSMNFLEGRLDGGSVMVGDHRFELPDELRRRIVDGAKEVLVGLRPEAFEEKQFAAWGTQGSLPAEIEVTEQLGFETLAYFRIPGLRAVELGERPVELAGALAARLDPRTSAVPGSRLELAVDTRQLHLFDPDTGQALLAPE